MTEFKPNLQVVISAAETAAFAILSSRLFKTRLVPYILDTAVRNGLDSKDSDEAKGIPLTSR